jgi:hypothetical protein
MRLEEGDVNVLQDKGNYNHTVGGDYNLEVAGHMHVVVGKDVVNEIGGNRDERIDGDFDQKYLTKSSGYLGEYLSGDKRTYVSGNQINEVTNTISESAKFKKQKYGADEKDVTGACVTKAGGSLWLVGKTVAIQSLTHMVIRSNEDMDIFCAELGKGKLKIYSADTADFIAERYGSLRSAQDKIEIKSPTMVKALTPKIYLPEQESAPPFNPEAKPLNSVNPSQYSVPEAEKTKDHMKNNKKEWIKTKARKQ